MKKLSCRAKSALHQAGYAAGNLAVMSARANRAKSAYDWRDAATFVRQIEADHLGEIDGLSAREWARLAALMSYCTPPSHAEAANLPLLVLPPPRLRVLNPVQTVQAGLTLCFARTDRAPKLDALVRIFPAGVQFEARSFMTTLLARRIAAGPVATPAQLRAALEAAWCEPLIVRRWQRVALRMSPACCEKVVAALPTAAAGLAPLRYLGGTLQRVGLRHRARARSRSPASRVDIARRKSSVVRAVKRQRVTEPQPVLAPFQTVVR